MGVLGRSGKVEFQNIDHNALPKIVKHMGPYAFSRHFPLM